MDIDGIVAISFVVGMLLLLGADLGLNVRVIEFLWDRVAGEPRLKEKTSLSSPEATDADEVPEEEGVGGGRGEDFGLATDTMLNPRFRTPDEAPPDPETTTVERPGGSAPHGEPAAQPAASGSAVRKIAASVGNAVLGGAVSGLVGGLVAILLTRS